MKKNCFTVLLLLIAFQSNAQRILTYGEYIKNVREKNIEYIVEKYNISIAEANTRAAKIMPDPEFSFVYEDSQDKTLHMGQSYSGELGYTIELGGKRRARIAAAKSEQQITETLVEDFFRNLRADATLCYIDALKQKQIVSLAFSSYQSIKDLARADSLRYSLGEITEVGVMQTSLEAATLMADYVQAESDYKNTLSDLVIFEGSADAIDSLSGSLPLIVRTYMLHNLIELAQDNRADLRAAMLGRELSNANLKLAKANRIIDLGLNIGFTHNTVALNEEAPSPQHNTISAGISIPLKLSSANKGELRAAQYSEQQSEARYNTVLMQIRKEVEQCYNNYISALRQAEWYHTNTLADAAKIFEKKKYSYLHGETSLLDVLEAQRTANEVYRSYYETLYKANASFVELCRAVGIWEVEL